MNAVAAKTELLEILYIGSKDGLERELVQQCGWPYVAIPVGKFRRYWDFKNLIDPFKVAAGFLKAIRVIHRFKPDVIFSKGGYVSLPVMAAGRLLRVPIVLHDSDARPSLTTKIVARWVKTLCLGYAQAARHLPRSAQKKIVVTGIPIREEIFSGNRKKGFSLTGFNSKKPILLVMGGSLGAEHINEVLRAALPQLLKHYQVIHLTGKGKYRPAAPLHERSRKSYKVFEYAKEELPHLYAISDGVVSRAGANAIAEIETLKKPCVLIPLGSDVSHGDQRINAQVWMESGKGVFIPDHELTVKRLVKAIHTMMQKKPQQSTASLHTQAAKKIATRLIGIARRAA